MRRIKDTYRQLVDHPPDGPALHKVILDTNGKPVDYIFLDANSAFEALSGRNRE